jgi:hypothetical protein
MKTINSSGKKDIRAYFLNTLNMKALRMLSRVWPANMLAKSRTDRLKGLIRYDTTSIITRKGIKGLGTPLGTNKFKNPN